MILLAAALIALAVRLLTPGRAVRRLPAPHPSVAVQQGRRWLLWLAGAGAGLGCGVLLGGPAGLVLGAVVAATSIRLLRRFAAADATACREALAVQAPEVAELLAACLAAGAGLEPAAAAVAAAVQPPAAGLLTSAVAHLRLGAPPEQALAEIAATAELAPISRAISRSLDSGAPLVKSLTLCAEELRNTRRSALQTKARQVAVRTVGPLGLCFLPAFLMLGVVPLVAGLLQRSLTGIDP